ncbi:MAG: glycosyltransferase [Phycisphaerae bacterium]|nr:glycosyltransferase [Phycisphaerae bacterium]
MKVFMLGWEFPPHISGGLGTACHGLTKGLDELGVDVVFVVPTAVPVDAPSHVTLQSPATLPLLNRSAADAPAPQVPQVPQSPDPKPQPASQERVSEHIELRQVSARLQPYREPDPTGQDPIRSLADAARVSGNLDPTAPTPIPIEGLDAGESNPQDDAIASAGEHYAGDLMTEVQKYARLALELAAHEEFDVIHAHDWMTFSAGQAVAAATGKPLVVHVHSTEFDRAGENINQHIYEIERTGMHAAGHVVCVSYLTRGIATSRYGVDASKISVVYNAVVAANNNVSNVPEPIKQDEKIVLFLGRLTMQKGPEYFLEAASKVIGRFKNVRFIIAGGGDMIDRCVKLAADMNIGRYVTFTGFLRGDDVARVFKMADLYVMPSVSEPFGIAPLEAISHDVPVIISKQSGVSEILTHALKVDFWDTDDMANKILAVLRHDPLQRTLRKHGQIEVQKLSWLDSARELSDIYQQMASGA